TLDGKSSRGPICFDLDEKYQLEVLDGKHKEITYQIPFEMIKSIKPLNREESEIMLKNGKSIVLEDKVDVDENNDGVLVFTDIRNPQYIPWAEISMINFK
ncbi:MAG: hypothetical protein HKN67_05590, partial [Saprospiraceae bacterium]|nr:hypothetical protein [Saprospiraceae bacterium]